MIKYILCYMFEPSMVIGRKLSVKVDMIKHFVVIWFQLLNCNRIWRNQQIFTTDFYRKKL